MLSLDLGVETQQVFLNMADLRGCSESLRCTVQVLGLLTACRGLSPQRKANRDLVSQEHLLETRSAGCKVGQQEG